MAALPVLLHLVALAPAEPVFHGDANRHVMTSVFFRDFLVDAPLSHPKQYAEAYYKQYPALGLMVWPPLFHGVVGVLMTVFGTSALVARLFVFATFAFAAICLFRLCRRRMTDEQASLVTVIFSLMPMTFQFSRFIMLEMPTLALCLFCIERFDAWLTEQRTCNLYVAAVAAALAALTRFDAAVLLPTLLLMAAFERKLRQLFTWHVPIAAAIALTLLGPTYVVIWRELGELHLRQATESVSGTASQMFASGSLWYYPASISGQTGWFVFAFFIIGLIAAFGKQNRPAAKVFAALLIGTYATFTPLAELRPRHAIYWLPAIAYFAATGTGVVARAIQNTRFRRNNLGTVAACVLIIGGTCITTIRLAPFRVVGYATAANAALQHSHTGDSIFIDGWWDGNITYHLRHLDPGRSRHIIRADQLLYEFTNVPTVDFQQHMETDAEILDAILNTNASCIVFEDPQPFGEIPISRRIHELIKSLPDQFPPLETVPVSVAFPGARQFNLKVFSMNSAQLRAHLDLMDDNRTNGTQNVPAFSVNSQVPGLTKSQLPKFSKP